MYERGEAGPRPNAKLLDKAVRRCLLAKGRVDIGYVNGVPYGLCTMTEHYAPFSINTLTCGK